ncbi:hypothetical protein [Rhodococcoides yunnanense]|uniref:hypothetical protein n=1 Tax=Rhodococcoides yunnanense TaxID=278209 RepID=UPI0014733F98|nr:hypothetical protein [Rhodococcus yunnanensis]
MSTDAIRIGTVVERRYLTAGMIRVVFGGEDLKTSSPRPMSSSCGCTGAATASGLHVCSTR